MSNTKFEVGDVIEFCSNYFKVLEIYEKNYSFYYRLLNLGTKDGELSYKASLIDNSAKLSTTQN